MQRKLVTIATIGVLAILAGPVQAQGNEGLWGYDGSSNDLYEVDANPVNAIFIGNDPTSGIPSEIEYGGGFIYASDTGDNTNLHVLDPSSGLVLNTITMNFPGGGDVITSMEFVGNTLYGGFTTEGGGDTFLTTIDTTTGDVNVVGVPSGVGSPLGGLAYDADPGVMYAITAGGSQADLYTIDLGSGAASFVAGVRDAAGAPIGLTALEFGTDGTLYALPNASSNLAGHLLSIVPATGIYTDLGDTGVGSMNGLTSIPGPGALALLAIAGLGARRRRA